MSDDDAEIPYPEVAVWNHLHTGVDLAVWEMNVLDDRYRDAAEKLGKELVDVRAQLVRTPNSREGRVIGSKLDEHLLDHPWIRYAAEIEIAGVAIGRATVALDRYFRVRPTLTARPLPDSATRYVTEVINTFAFGFDMACIALCRATLEQVLKDELIRGGVMTAAQIKRNQPTANTLLASAKAAGILSSSVPAAEQLIKKANNVMHKFLYEERVSEQQAMDSIAQLMEVLRDALRGDGRPNSPES